MVDGCDPKDEAEELPKAGGAADPPKLKLGLGGLLPEGAVAAPALKLNGEAALLAAGAGGLLPPKEKGEEVLAGAGFDALGAFLPKVNIDPPEVAVVVAGAPPNKLLGWDDGWVLAEKLKEGLAGSVAAAALNPPDAVVVAGAAPNKLPAGAAGLLPEKLKADLAGSVVDWDLAVNIELWVVVAGAEAPNVNGDAAAGAVVVDGWGWALKENEGFGASKVAAFVTAGAADDAPKVGAEALGPPRVE